MEGRGVAFQAGPEPGTVRRQDRGHNLDREPVGEWQEQALAVGHKNITDVINSTSRTD